MTEQTKQKANGGPPPEEASTTAPLPSAGPDWDTLFADAVAGQERIHAMFHPEEASTDDGDESSSGGVRGVDVRELQRRMSQTLKDQAVQIAEQQKKIADLEEQIAQWKDRWLRLQADDENFRKRMMKERDEQMRYGNERLLRELFPIVDSFELALASASTSSAESLLAGVRMILSQLEGVLGRFGVEKIESLGQAFDPNLHEAFQQIETREFPAGHVGLQMQPGYRLHGRLLRPARVGVAVPPRLPGEAPPPPETEGADNGE